MIIAKEVFSNMINAPVRSFRGRVEVYNASTLATICGCHDKLKSFTVERIGENNKFFGFGVCQKLTVDFIDINRELEITKDHNLEVELGIDNDYIYPCPNFYIEDIKRNENTNELRVIAYDALYKANDYKVSDLELTKGYTIADFAGICAALLGLPISIDKAAAASFNTLYNDGANFDGTETIREALDAIAEATQTIYYIDYNWFLKFKRLDYGEPVAIIGKEQYMELTANNSYTLANIAHITELGDNITTTTGIIGSTQYIKNNPFWELREDIAELVNDAVDAVKALSITPFNCSWRGNFLLEIGDKIGLVTKDNSIINTYVLADSFTFNGGLKGVTSWSYTEGSNDATATPTTIGEAIKETYAKVNKVDKKIELVASEAEANTSAISALQINTESINASVTKIEEETRESIEEVNSSIDKLTTKVSAQLTPEDIRLEINRELENGVETIKTGKGYTFNGNGLTIEDINPDTNNDIKTTVSNNGMVVNSNNNNVLVANDAGVIAKDLKAVTYLIIGNNSRFEDYNGRTACFWVGGNS